MWSIAVRGSVKLTVPPANLLTTTGPPSGAFDDGLYLATASAVPSTRPKHIELP